MDADFWKNDPVAKPAAQDNFWSGDAVVAKPAEKAPTKPVRAPAEKKVDVDDYDVDVDFEDPKKQAKMNDSWVGKQLAKVGVDYGATAAAARKARKEGAVKQVLGAGEALANIVSSGFKAIPEGYAGIVGGQRGMEGAKKLIDQFVPLEPETATGKFLTDAAGNAFSAAGKLAGKAAGSLVDVYNANPDKSLYEKGAALPAKEAHDTLRVDPKTKLAIESGAEFATNAAPVLIGGAKGIAKEEKGVTVTNEDGTTSKLGWKERRGARLVKKAFDAIPDSEIKAALENQQAVRETGLDNVTGPEMYEHAPDLHRLAQRVDFSNNTIKKFIAERPAQAKQIILERLNKIGDTSVDLQDATNGIVKAATQAIETAKDEPKNMAGPLYKAQEAKDAQVIGLLEDLDKQGKEIPKQKKFAGEALNESGRWWKTAHEAGMNVDEITSKFDEWKEKDRLLAQKAKDIESHQPESMEGEGGAPSQGTYSKTTPSGKPLADVDSNGKPDMHEEGGQPARASEIVTAERETTLRMEKEAADAATRAAELQQQLQSMEGEGGTNPADTQAKNAAIAAEEAAQKAKRSAAAQRAKYTKLTNHADRLEGMRWDTMEASVEAYNEAMNRQAVVDQWQDEYNQKLDKLGEHNLPGIQDKVQGLVGQMDQKLKSTTADLTADSKPITKEGEWLKELRDRIAQAKLPSQLESIRRTLADDVKASSAYGAKEPGYAGVMGKPLDDLTKLIDDVSPEIKKARAIYAEMYKDKIDPLKQSVVGTVAGRKGFSDTVEEPQTRVSNVFKGKNATESRVAQLADAVHMEDRNAFPNAFGAWLRERWGDATTEAPGDPQARSAPAKFMYDIAKNEKATDTMAMAVRKSAQGQDMTPQEANAAARGFKQLVKAMKSTKRIAGYGESVMQDDTAMQAREIAAVGHPGAYGAARTLSEKFLDTINKWNFENLAKVFTDKDSLRKMSQLAKLSENQKAAREGMMLDILTMGVGGEANQDANPSKRKFAAAPVTPGAPVEEVSPARAWLNEQDKQTEQDISPARKFLMESQQ